MPGRAGAALHGNAERLVQHQHVVIFKQDHPLNRGPVGFGQALRRLQRRLHRLILGCQPHDFGHADFAARLQPQTGFDPFARHPHLAGTQQLLQIAVLHERKVDLKPLVKADAGVLVRHPDRFNGGGFGWRQVRFGHQQVFA
jgi:hypothetical protein